LLGFVDPITPQGWAQNVNHLEAPFCLDICAGGRLIGQVLANRYSEDLERAGLGSGCNSFAFTPPDGPALTVGSAEVCRSLDGAALPLSGQANKGSQPAVACQSPAIATMSLNGPFTSVSVTPPNVCSWPCVTSIAGPYGDTQLYER
jgi:hypothetical protein